MRAEKFEWTQENLRALRALVDRLDEMEQERKGQQAKWSIQQWDNLLEQIAQKATK